MSSIDNGACNTDAWLSKPSRNSTATGRAVTLSMLIKDGVINPGEGVLSIDYLGRRFVADLLEDGRILWPESGEIFGTPSAWACHCKKFANPDKKSGCGWASVKYLNRKLDSWKTTWYRYHFKSMTAFGKPETRNAISTISELKPASLLNVIESCSSNDDQRLTEPVNWMKTEPANIADNVPLMILSFSQADVAQPHTIEIDGSLLFCLFLRGIVVRNTQRGDEHGLIMGKMLDHRILCTSALVLHSHYLDVDLRLQVAARINEEMLGWFHYHIGWHGSSPSKRDVHTQLDFQNEHKQMFGMVLNLQSNTAQSFTVFQSVKAQVPVDFQFTSGTRKRCSRSGDDNNKTSSTTPSDENQTASVIETSSRTVEFPIQFNVTVLPASNLKFHLNLLVDYNESTLKFLKDRDNWINNPVFSQIPNLETSIYEVLKEFNL